jgi:hypothetical protein
MTFASDVAGYHDNIIRPNKKISELLTCSLHGVLLEKLTGSQPVKKFPEFYGT